MYVNYAGEWGQKLGCWGKSQKRDLNVKGEKITGMVNDVYRHPKLNGNIQIYQTLSSGQQF